MRETPHTAFTTHPGFIRESKNVKDTGTIRREDSDANQKTLRDFMFRTCLISIYEFTS